MSELVLLILRIGFLVLLWFFVFGVVYSLRADLFGVRVRKLPAEGAAPVAAAIPPKPASPAAARPAKAAGGAATTSTVSKLVITSGPKTGMEVPLTGDPLTIGRSSESGLVIRDDYTSSHHARLILRADTWAVEDLDSTNGTFVADKRITGAPVTISIGTPIKVGQTTFELRA